MIFSAAKLQHFTLSSNPFHKTFRLTLSVSGWSKTAASSVKSGGRRRARGDGDARIQSHKFLKYLQNKAIPSSTTRFSSSDRQCAYFISSKASIIFWMVAFHSRMSFKLAGCPFLSKSLNVTRRGEISRANVFSVFHTSSIGKSCLWLQFAVLSPFFFFIFSVLCLFLIISTILTFLTTGARLFTRSYWFQYGYLSRTCGHR